MSIQNIKKSSSSVLGATFVSGKRPDWAHKKNFVCLLACSLATCWLPPKLSEQLLTVHKQHKYMIECCFGYFSFMNELINQREQLVSVNRKKTTEMNNDRFFGVWNEIMTSLTPYTIDNVFLPRSRVSSRHSSIDKSSFSARRERIEMEKFQFYCCTEISAQWTDFKFIR